MNLDGTITRVGLEGIIETCIGYHEANNALAIGVSNFQLLTRIARNEGLQDYEIFDGINDVTRNLCLHGDSDEYISNLDSLKIFENIGRHFPHDPHVFLRLGEEALNSVTMLKIIPYIIGRSVKDLTYILAGVNARFNKTKKFKIETNSLENGLMKTTVTVEHLPGLCMNQRVINWNIGMYNAMLSKSSEEIISTKTNFDESTSNFSLEVVYNSSAREKNNRLISYLGGKYIRKFEYALEKRAKNMILDRNAISNNISSELRNAMARVSALETRHPDSAYHSYRVTFYSLLLAKQLGMKSKELLNLSLGGPMHDDGKIAITETILHKKGGFDADERTFMKTHAVLGEYYLLQLGFNNEVARLATEHQEKANGSGYPYGIGWEITSTQGLIMQICDVFDALDSRRSYKEKWSLFEIQKEFEKFIDNGDFYKPFGEFFLEHTLPLIKNLNLNQRFDFTTPYFDMQRSNAFTREIHGFLKGQNSVFTVNNISKSTKMFMEKHYVDSKTKEDRLDNIGNYLTNAYLGIKSEQLREDLARIIPPQYHENLKILNSLENKLRV